VQVQKKVPTSSSLLAFLKCQQAEAHQHPPLTKEKTKKKKKIRKLTSKLMDFHVLQALPFPMLQIVPLQTLKLVPFSRSSSSSSFEALNPNAHVVHVFQVLVMEGSAEEG